MSDFLDGDQIFELFEQKCEDQRRLAAETAKREAEAEYAERLSTIEGCEAEIERLYREFGTRDSREMRTYEKREIDKVWRRKQELIAARGEALKQLNSLGGSRQDDVDRFLKEFRSRYE